jgi:hypothetical protein
MILRPLPEYCARPERALVGHVYLKELRVVFPISDVLEPLKCSLCLLRSCLCVFSLANRDRPLNAFLRQPIRVEQIVEKADAVLGHGPPPLPSSSSTILFVHDGKLVVLWTKANLGVSPALDCQIVGASAAIIAWLVLPPDFPSMIEMTSPRQ